MKQKNTPYRLDQNLLRPNLEWALAVFLSLTAIILYTLSMSYWPSVRPLVGLLSGSLLLWAAGMFFRGHRLWRYQRGLRGRRPYRLSLLQIKKKRHCFFLGRGFQWAGLHTQRLRDLERPCYHQHAQKIKKKAGYVGNTALHGVGFKDKPLYLPLSERVGHTLVLGTTGVGKTRLAELLITQDILRGDTVIVIDPKGDVGLFRQMVYAAQQAHRLKDLHLFHLGFPEYSRPYNPIARFNEPSEVAHRVTHTLPSQGDSAAFQAFAWQFVDTVVQTLHHLGETPTYQALLYYITHREALIRHALERHLFQQDAQAAAWIQVYQDTCRVKQSPVSLEKALAAYLKAHPQQTPWLDHLHHLCTYETTYYTKIIASLLPLLKKLTSSALLPLLSPPASVSALNWSGVLQHQQIVYVGLDALSDSTVARAIGNALLSDLVSLSGHLYKTSSTEHEPAPINLHVDEFSDIMGEEFVPLLNKARGVGFQVTAYTQTGSDIEARLGNAAKAQQVIGNFNTCMMFRVKEAKTANDWIAGLPQVPFYTALPGQRKSIATTAQTVVSTTQTEQRWQTQTVPMLSASDLLSLPIGEAFIRLRSGELIKCRCPLLESPPSELPTDMKGLLAWLATFSEGSLA